MSGDVHALARATHRMELKPPSAVGGLRDEGKSDVAKRDDGFDGGFSEGGGWHDR